MSNVPWPDDLPYQPFRDSLAIQPPKVLTRDDMDGGNVRVRRRTLVETWTYPLRQMFTAAQFELFKTYYSVALDEGAAWFDVPLFHGEDYEEAACRFVDRYEARLRGVNWFVTSSFETEGLKILTKAEANVRWPGSIP